MAADAVNKPVLVPGFNPASSFFLRIAANQCRPRTGQFLNAP
jgi:hypothetical protein